MKFLLFVFILLLSFAAIAASEVNHPHAKIMPNMIACKGNNWEVVYQRQSQKWQQNAIFSIRMYHYGELVAYDTANLLIEGDNGYAVTYKFTSLPNVSKHTFISRMVRNLPEPQIYESEDLEWEGYLSALVLGPYAARFIGCTVYLPHN